MKSIKNLAALALALPAAYVAIASPAHAAVTSASIDGQTATLNLDGADDNVTVSVSNGLLVHGQTTGGLNSGADWDSATPGDQTVPANGTFGVNVNGNGGNDAITVVAKATETSGVKLDGGPGDDVLTGANSDDSLSGGDGNDRLVGGPGADTISGDAGNDTMVWNNGDGTDTVDGGAGNDTTEVNGSQTLGDVFTLAPDQNPGQVKFQRTNLVAFTIHSTAENFRVNGLGGNDTVTAGNGLATLLSVDGGAGADTITGSDGPDLITGGEDNDVLNGGGGDDRIVGDRGSDTINGGAGDDTLVWNNGDGTDVMNGDAGRDDIEVNGSPTAGDVFTVKPNGSRIRFDRTNLVPFTLDIGSSETLHANGLGGDDSITDGDVGAFSVTANGGPGNDTLTGGGSSETLLGGSGNDKITGGGGIDVVSGDDGDDQVNVRDRTADIALGGAGNDTAIADTPNLDILDGFESVDRSEAGVPPVTPGHGNGHGTRAVTIGGGAVKVSRKSHTAAIRVSCPAGSAGHCTGSVTVSTAGSVHLAGLRARLQLGSARYDLAPGTSKRVKVKLARGVERLADRKGHVKVRVVATTGTSGNAASTSRRLTLSVQR